MDIKQNLAEIYPEIDEAPSCTIIKVHWGELDAAQHVNNIIYLRWTETGRIEYFEKIGIDTAFQKISPILGWMDAKYIRPVRYPDHVLVTTETHEIRADRIVLLGKVYSSSQQHIAALSYQEIIPYDYQSLQKVAIPEKWLSGIRSLQPEPF